jgi:DNA-binding IclR family transcriptional regulator
MAESKHKTIVHQELELEGNATKDARFVSSIARTFEVLRAFRPGEGPLSNAELSEVTGLPKATVARLTHTLKSLGYLTSLGNDNRFEPSPSILALGYCVLSNLRVRQLAQPQMTALAKHASASVGLASRDRLGMIYLAMTNGSPLRTMRHDVGTRVNIEKSAIGRAFLAGVTADEKEYFFGHLARKLGAAWPDTRDRIEASIAEVRERGFCLVDGEWQRDTRAVACPVVSPDQSTVLAINCVAPSFQISNEQLVEDIGPRLAHLASGLVPMMGGT